MVYLEIYSIFNGIESKCRVGIVLRDIFSDVDKWGEVSVIFNMDRIFLCGINLLFLYVYIGIS